MYFGKIPRPAFGVRIPDIVIPSILKCFKKLNVVGTLMLSFNRETAPEEYIRSLDPKHFYLGHSGTSIKEYIEKSRYYSAELTVPVEVEADHISIMGSVERALKKIAGVAIEEPVTEPEIEFSINYIEDEFKEVSKSGGVDFITIDTCELIDYSIDKLTEDKILNLYEEKVEKEERKSLETYYLDKVFTFLSDDRQVSIRLGRTDLARLVLKYMKSIDYVIRLYTLAKEYIQNPFGIEIAFDETPYRTHLKDVFFYVMELKRRGLSIDFVAPNIGFKKREDYDGNLVELYEYLKNINSILNSLGVYISIHSGSGHNPYSDKGFGLWRVIGMATNGKVKYKMSGVFIQLLLEVMSRMDRGSRARRLYEEIYDAVIDHLQQIVKSKGALYSKELEKMLLQYELQEDKYSPRADVFRHYFYVFQALRNGKGIREYRESLIQLYASDAELQNIYEKEICELIYRLASNLNYIGNIIKYKRISL